MTNLIILEFRVFLFVTYKQPAWSPEPLLLDVPYLPAGRGQNLSLSPKSPGGLSCQGEAPHSPHTAHRIRGAG